METGGRALSARTQKPKRGKDERGLMREDNLFCLRHKSFVSAGAREYTVT